jgi:hypothetical protein
MEVGQAKALLRPLDASSSSRHRFIRAGAMSAPLGNLPSPLACHRRVRDEPCCRFKEPDIISSSY